MAMPSDPTAKDAPRHDVFISYSSKNRLRAIDLARLFESFGWRVWLDKWRLVVGESFRQKIDTALDDSRVVVVLWSKTSVTSQWVAAEATTGNSRGALLPARLDDAEPPMPFGELETADLRAWDGLDPNYPELRRLCEGVAAKLGQPLPSPEAIPAPKTRWLLALQSFGPVVTATFLITIILTWLVFRAGLATPIAYGLPVGLSVLLFFLRGIDRIDAVRRWVAEVACSRLGLAGLFVIAGTLSIFTSVRIEVVRHGPLGATLYDGSGSGTKALRSGTLSAGARSVRWLLPVPPWGRPVTVAVEGYDSYAARLYPWRGVTARPNEELIPHPVILLRVHRLAMSVTPEARLSLKYQNSTIAEQSLSNGHGSLLIGGERDLGPLQEEWRRKLTSQGVPAEQVNRIVALWGNPVSTGWSARPPELDGEVVMVLTTRGGQEWRSKSFRLQGAFTDVEHELIPSSP